jgi:hypothetical protein
VRGKWGGETRWRDTFNASSDFNATDPATPATSRDSRIGLSTSNDIYTHALKQWICYN